MGYTSTIKSAYWGPQANPITLGNYKNDTSVPQIIQSITCHVGIGKASTPYTWGSYLTGTGRSIQFYVQCAGINSSTTTLTNPIDSILGSGGYYPNRSQCSPATVTFDNLIVQPGSTVYFTLPWMVMYTNNIFIINERIPAEVPTVPANYTITYNANGGTNAPAAQTKVHNTALALTSNKPTGPTVTLTLNANGGSVSEPSKQYARAFKNWNTAINGSGTSYPSGASFTSNANTTLYAQYDVATVSGLPTPTRAGHSFQGWFTSTDTQVINGTTFSSSMTATARWSANSYTVSYNANGGSNAPAAQTKYHGTNLVLSTAQPNKSIVISFNANGGTVSPTSRTLSAPFTRWNTQADGRGTSYPAGSTYSDNNSITLYAQWSPATVGTLPAPTRANCQFVGWYSATNGGSQIHSTNTYTTNSTVYARWNYNIVYDLNGGSVGEGETTIANTIKKHQVEVSLTSVTPTKYGMTFLGWSETKTATTATYAPGSRYTKDAPTTLYAVYGVASYTVKFDLVGGTHTGGGALTQSVKHGQSATLPNNPTKSGSQFRGWLGDYTNITKNTTIVAMWNNCPLWILKSDKKWHGYLEK